MTSKIIVTGSSGYVASSLIPALLAHGDVEVIGIDRDPMPSGSGSPAFGPRFQLVRCDLSDPKHALEAEVFSGATACVHLAAARGDWAISTEEYWRDNRDATAGLLQAPWAPAVPRWIFMSSVSVYGPSETALSETAPHAPIGAYGQSKLASEELFKAFVSRHGVQGCSVRPSAVFSPGHPANTNVYKLIESLRRFPMPLIGGGHNRKTLTYLPNLVDLIQWLLEAMSKDGLSHDTYNYIEEPVMTVRELIDALRAAGLRPARQLPIPMGLAVAGSYPVWMLSRLIGVDLRITPERVRKFAASTWYDASRVLNDGFKPGVSLDQALQQTVQWHLGSGRQVTR